MRRARIRAVSILAVVALGLAAAACGGGGGVKVTESDFKIELASSSAKAGEITFKVKNNGPSVHEFVVFKTDLAPDQLPTKKDENGIEIVDESGAGVKHIDEIEDINPNTTKELKITLDAGKYVLICNLPAHYKQGMHAAFEATA